MSNPTPITAQELEEMKGRSDRALHMPLRRMVIELAHQREELVAISKDDSPTIEQCIRDLSRCLGEIERLRTDLNQQADSVENVIIPKTPKPFTKSGWFAPLKKEDVTPDFSITGPKPHKLECTNPDSCSC